MEGCPEPSRNLLLRLPLTRWRYDDGRCGAGDWPGGRSRAGAAMPVVEHEVVRVGKEGGGAACRERRRERFTAVSLDFCTTYQNSAACRQALGGRAATRSVHRAGHLFFYALFIY